MTITGHTRVIAVIGDPIEAARAPQALNEAAAALGADVVAVPAGIPAEGLPAFVAAARGWRNLAGLVVTMPHKAAIAGLVDRLSDGARASGAVNIVRRDADGFLLGDQIDGEGFVASLRSAGHAVAGAGVVMLGAGGVARSIAFALAAAGIARIRIVNRSPERAVALVEDLRRVHSALDAAVGAPEDAREAALLINATSVGSLIQPGLPLDPDLIEARSVVADVIANPARTELLAEAERRGARIHTGVQMQQAQLHTIFDFLVGNAAARGEEQK
jgi:shikimate dehydrogenase